MTKKTKRTIKYVNRWGIGWGIKGYKSGEVKN